MKVLENNEIKKCPFCGAKPEIRPCKNMFKVRCTRCKAVVTSYEFEGAIKKWNCRSKELWIRVVGIPESVDFQECRALRERNEEMVARIITFNKGHEFPVAVILYDEDNKRTIELGTVEPITPFQINALVDTYGEGNVKYV